MKSFKSLIQILMIGIPILFLSGCASMFNSEVIETVTNEAGEVTTTVATATTLRDKQYLERGNLRDKYTKQMYEDSGVNMTFERYTFTSPDGSFTFTSNDIKSVSVRAPNTWMQKIVTQTPDHRFWASLDNGFDLVFKGFLSYLTFGVLDTAISKDTTAYQGDYITESYNPTTTNPYTVQ